MSHGPSATPGIQRVVMLYNPVSHNAVGWPNYIDDVREDGTFGPPLAIASQARAEDTIDELSGILRDGDALMVLSGDGVINDAAQLAGSISAPNITIAFTPLGNARNAYKATTDPDFDGRPSTLLKEGTTETIYPMRATVRGSENYDQLAVTTIDVGAIATGAYFLDQPAQRNHPLRRSRNEWLRLKYEQAVSARLSLTQMRTLEIADFDGENQRLALDTLVANAPVIAKVAKFDTSITEHDFLLGTIPNRWHQLPSMIRLTRGTLPVRRIANNEDPIRFMLTHSDRNQNARIQLDGQSRRLAMGSLVTLDQPGYDDVVHRPIPVLTMHRQES